MKISGSFFLLVLLTIAAPAMAKPNFLFVFIDDMGYADLGCFGGTRAKTPQVDRLAREGIRFTKFYVNSPICSPSRVAVTTGQYPQRWGITSYLAHRKENHRRGMKNWLSPDAPSLARILRDAGYHTAHVGKWHMGGQRDVGDAPRISAYGFDASITNFEGLGERVLPLFGFNHEPTLTSARLGGGPVRWVDREKVSEIFCDRAIEEMNRAAAAGKPFYINLWPDDVHTPCVPDYVTVLSELDRQVGRVFEHIRATPVLAHNTIILLASDNGHEEGQGSGGGLRGSKSQLYEGGIRSPLIVWSAKMTPATNEATVLAGMDIPPSVLALAGIPVPADAKFDGLDMSAALAGKSQPMRDAPIMWSRPPDRPGPKNDWPDLAIREGKWKLLTDRDGGNVELFDVVGDSNERENVAEKQGEIVKRMKRSVMEWDRSMQQNHDPRGSAALRPGA